MGDFKGFSDSRRRAMLIQPNMFANWLAYLVGAYLNKEYDVCLEIFDSMD